MSQAFKICPICSTANHTSATVCTMCGASLIQIEPLKRTSANHATMPTDYDFRYGETDLQEMPRTKSRGWFASILVALVAFLLGGVAFALAAGYLRPADVVAPILADSPTPSPTLHLVTVTLGPPTPTSTNTPLPTFTPSMTFTPEPCYQTIVQGDSLIGAIARCGHKNRDVIPTVVALNNLRDANSVQLGQVLIIPWPTPTTDPNATLPPTATPQAGASNSGGGADVLALDESISAFAPTVIPTLPAGVMWHEVAPEENISVIVNRYGVNVKVLSELNPEMDFARCDFGNIYGGPGCIIGLSIGQLIRVPAPTPLPTLPPTLDPNATATPTATATYNEPAAIAPPDRQFFRVDELVTLRWLPSATLLIQESYRVEVEDTTTGTKYSALTKDIAFILPLEWQGRSQARHEYVWTVGIVNDATPDQVRYRTRPLSFVWQGLVEEEKP